MKESTQKRIINADVIGLVLTCFAIPVLLYGLEASLRGTQTRSLLWICLVAAGIGLGGGKSKCSGAQMSAVIAALGILEVWILGARIARPLFELMWSLTATGPQIFPEINYRFDINANTIVSTWNLIGLSSSALLARWQTWLITEAQDFTVNDVLIRNLLWTFALWLLSASIGWFAAKRNAIASLLPGVLLLVLLTWSSERRVEAPWALVVMMLLLMGIWNYKQRAQHWDTHGIDYSDSIRYDMSQSVVMVVMVAGLVAFITPSISWQDVQDYLREREREHTQASEVATNPSSSTNGIEPSNRSAPKASLPREHLLTGGYAQSTDIVMTIRTGELPPGMIPSAAVHTPRHYWRNVIYDQYGGDGWYTTSAPSQSLTSNEPMIAGVLSGYGLLHLNVQMQQPEGRLHWTGILYSADIPLTVDWRLRPQSNLFADQSALLQADMFAARTNATSYKADSYVPSPSIEQLRAAPAEEYPQHIRDRYFSLPGTVPQRVRQLAKEITNGAETPYDKAKAIETYLRVNYPYDLEISAPPEDRDVADYFLFDLRRGYCDYYATAMVVLARSSGIPARFVSGYAPGEYDALNAQYVIRELHAHSWAEVYFPEIGWVEFEPTGSQPEIERAEAIQQGVDIDASTSIRTGILFEWKSWKMGVLFVPLAFAVLMLLIYFTMIESFIFSRLAPQAAIAILYQRLYRLGRPLAGEYTRAETANEFTSKLIHRVQSINSNVRRSTHRLQTDVKDLTAVYQVSLFSNHACTRQDVNRALMLWKRLRWSLTLERMKYSFLIRNKAGR